jgi:starch phosphorylase
VESGGVDAVPQVGDELHVRAQVNLDGLSAEDVAVEVVYGRAREGDRLENPERIELTASPEDASTASNPLHPVQFTGTVTLSRAGSFGYNVRVVPRNPLLASPAELGLVAVAS